MEKLNIISFQHFGLILFTVSDSGLGGTSNFSFSGLECKIWSHAAGIQVGQPLLASLLWWGLWTLLVSSTYSHSLRVVGYNLSHP